MNSKKSQAAYMEEADDDSGYVIANTKIAAVVAPGPEKSNIGKTRRSSDRHQSRRTDSSSPNTPAATQHTDSDSTVHPTPASTRREKDRARAMREKEKEQEREQRKEMEKRQRAKEKAAAEREREKQREREARERSASKKSAKSRPPPQHSKTAPVVSQSSSHRRPSEAEFYGQRREGVPVITPSAPPVRQRSMTSNPNRYSYSGHGNGTKPPQANARWHAMGPPPPPPHQPVFTPGVSYPPQYPYPSIPPSPSPVSASPFAAPPIDYFSQNSNYQHLQNRFQRPSSAMGFRQSSGSSTYSEDFGDQRQGGLFRRPSLTRKEEEDRMAMPPPVRPRTVMPMSASGYGPPPPPPPQRSSPFLSAPTVYADEDYHGAADMYQEVVAARRTSQDLSGIYAGRRGSVSYDLPGGYTVEPASSSKTRRRHSYIGGSGGGNGGGSDNYDEKIRMASAYQEDINGGPRPALTKDNVRRALRSGPSSRSTRSTSSRDESDWKQSATTRTTRSSGDEDITIKVVGEAIVKVGGAEIQCQDGGEINIARRDGGGGSEADSSVYIENSGRDMNLLERKSRSERLPTRTRTISQSGGWSHGQGTGTAYDVYGRPYGYNY